MGYRLPKARQDPQGAVLQAVRTGANSASIEAGEYRMGKGLFIPSGRDGFSIKAPNVVLKSNGRYSGVLLYHGSPSASGNGTNSSFPNYASRVTIGATIGRDDTIFNPVVSVPAGYYVLFDPALVTTYSPNDDGTNPSTNDVQRELVYVETNGLFGRQPTRIVTGGVGQGAIYGQNSFLNPVSSIASRNIDIDGLELDGSNHPGGYADRLSSMWFIDGFTHNVKTRYFHDNAFSTYLCRNKTANVLECAYSSAGSTGEGYCHADYGIYNAELFSSLGMSNPSLAAFYDIGSPTVGLRQAWYKAYGANECYQHDFRVHEAYGQTDSPAIEIGPHVGPGRGMKAERIRLAGTANGLAGGGHQKFGYGAEHIIGRDIDVNWGQFQIVAAESAIFESIFNYNDKILIGWGNRMSLVFGAYPTAPRGNKDILFKDNSGSRTYTGTGFQANQERLEGNITFENDSSVNPYDSANVRLRSEVECRVVFDSVDYRNNATVFRNVDLGAGAGLMRLQVIGGYYQNENASNNREAYILRTSGIVETAYGYYFTSAANTVSPTFMYAANGGWQDPVFDSNP